MKWFFVVALLLALTACSSKDEERRARQEAQCLTADWRGIGYEDGAKGRKTDNIARHRKACAEFGVSPNLDAYLDGHAQGVASYCQPNNGYLLGTRGRRYSGGCPAGQDAAFADAMGAGYGLWERQKAVDDAGGRLSDSRQRSLQLEHILAEKSTLMFSPDLALTARPALAIEIKQLTQEKIEIERAIPQLEASYGAAQRELDDYRRSVSGRYAE